MSEVADPSRMNAELLRVPVTLQFNKTSRAFVSIIRFAHPAQRQWLDEKYFEYRDVELDIDKETIIGNLDKFEIVQKSMLPQEILESGLDMIAGRKIDKRFPEYRQLNIMSSLFKEILDRMPAEQKAALPPALIEQFEEMRDYVELVRHENRIRKESMKTNPEINYISLQDEAKRQQELFAGGAHEVHGPGFVTARQDANRR